MPPHRSDGTSTSTAVATNTSTEHCVGNIHEDLPVKKVNFIILLKIYYIHTFFRLLCTHWFFSALWIILIVSVKHKM